MRKLLITGQGILVVLVTMGSFSFSEAAVLTGHYSTTTPDFSTDYQAGGDDYYLTENYSEGYNRIGQSFTLPVAATIDSISLYGAGGVWTDSVHVRIYEWTGTELSEVAQSNSTEPGSLGWFDLTFTSFALPAGTYVFSIKGTNNMGGAGPFFYYSKDNPFPSGCLTDPFLATSTVGTTCDTGRDADSSDWLFKINGEVNSTSGITNVTSPINLTDLDGLINFHFAYFNGIPSYDYVGFTLRDLTRNQSAVAQESELFSSGSGTFDLNLQLLTETSYSWRPYMRTSGGSYTYGPTYYFNTGDYTYIEAASSTITDFFYEFINGSGSGSIIQNALNNGDFNSEANAATSTASGVASFGNIPAYFAERIPFGYIYDIYDAWNTVSTSSDEFAALSIGFDDLGLSTTSESYLPSSVIFFSTSTVTTYIDDSLLALLNALASAGIAVSWGMMVFRRATNVIKPV